jgi:GNAT superfamily N-acetyltransferase
VSELRVQVHPLSSHPELRPTVQRWFTEEWPSYYDSSARAATDVLAYSKAEGLPRGFVAVLDGLPCGFAALKSESFPSHPELGPWAGAAYVPPELRRRGIGAALLAVVEAEAAFQGHKFVYCATGTSASLLQRAGWKLLEQVAHEGQNVGVYEKAL